jgi:2,4-dienoyl-CoA reductase-like NADH-dependent reductase (Old Yellow Enzyme family)
MTEVPALFQPLTIRGVTLKNRIVVSPMCQYSSEDGFANFWHVQHIGSRVVGGAGLFIVEAAGVSAEGRITAGCLGIYKDEHITMLKQIVDFTHQQGGHIGIQIGHAGRKAGTGKLWEETRGTALPIGEGGWEVKGASPVAYDDKHRLPTEMTGSDIEQVTQQFVDAAARSVQAGFDVIEIHGAHGYLISSFLSSTSNKRTDKYGGPIENRIRILTDIVTRVRETIPNEMPLFVRISADEYVEGGWTMDDTVYTAKVLKELGVDLLDCSSGGNSAGATINPFIGYQIPFAARVKSEAQLASGAVGKITESEFANTIVQEGKADLVFVGRKVLNDPYWPIRAAKELGYSGISVPPQYAFASLK